MKKIVMVLGIVGIVVGMMVAETIASQIIGTPLYTDSGRA